VALGNASKNSILCRVELSSRISKVIVLSYHHPYENHHRVKSGAGYGSDRKNVCEIIVGNPIAAVGPGLERELGVNELIDRQTSLDDSHVD
jgi:hypothetical protein